ncbi:MAG: TIGR03905 family TSCPD domain-containing protein [Oscillospiraceae bacterium]|nr:TIGR03905 family TSCPD domain-containing protein [Oscillospiraceae bacterium]
MTINYTPSKVCAKQILVEVNDGVVGDVRFVGGCGGNAAGISKLAKGMKADELIKRLENINCGGRGTSCPDQLAQALKTFNGEQ